MVWSPNKITDDDLNLLLKALKRYGEEAKSLHNKIWCWKMNFRNKDHE